MIFNELKERLTTDNQKYYTWHNCSLAIKGRQKNERETVGGGFKMAAEKEPEFTSSQGHNKCIATYEIISIQKDLKIR